MRKLSLDFIKLQFSKEKYELLSKDYINSLTKLEYKCDKGHINTIRWGDYQQGTRCPDCHKISMRISYDHIKDSFESEGYILISKYYKDNKTTLYYLCNRKHLHYINWNNWCTGYRCPICNALDATVEGSGNWKGGVSKDGLPLYETYAPQLGDYQPVYKIIQDGLELLGVNCVYCGEIFIPKRSAVQSKISSMKSTNKGENNFYCSENCKKACPTYRKQKYPKGFKPATSREVQPELRKLVLARDNYKCQICEAGLDDVELHCHHITGVEQNPIESADIDNCITLCKKHHKQVHTLPNCAYNDLRCN